MTKWIKDVSKQEVNKKVLSQPVTATGIKKKRWVQKCFQITRSKYDNVAHQKY